MSKLYLTEAQAAALFATLNLDEMWLRVTKMVTEEFGLTNQDDIDMLVGAYCQHLEEEWRKLTLGMPLDWIRASGLLERNPQFIKTRKGNPE